MVDSIIIALTWCLAWGEDKKPQFKPDQLKQIRDDITKVDPEIQKLVNQVQKLQELPFRDRLDSLKDGELWQQNTKIGLVYGGATKIKSYVFDSAKLPEVRGASAILDRINLVDLPAFFRGEEAFLDEEKQKPRFPECNQAPTYCQEVRKKLKEKLEKKEKENLQQLLDALIPELIIYSTGGNILAFCPVAFVDDLANLIEKQYTTETLTANSCAVGETFRLLEIRFGLLKENIAETPWLYFYKRHKDKEIVKTYFKNQEITLEELEKKKSFNELVGKLTARFERRRNGNDIRDRPSRRYPPMFETHPYLIRDTSDRASAVEKVKVLPDKPNLSETLARKRYVGQITKKDGNYEWFKEAGFDWDAGEVISWVEKFKRFLGDRHQNYCDNVPNNSQVTEARSLTEIGNVSDGFVAYIYADGNNMGGYIQGITTPQEYMEFSRDVFDATEKSVYYALEEYLKPRQLKNLTAKDNKHRNGEWIYPFEIITIGGDDVLLIVPANKALEIVHTIGVKFEEILLSKYIYEESHKKYPYKLEESEIVAKSFDCNRYSFKDKKAKTSKCKLSTSIGVLITSYSTPIYYANRLVEQLLSSAKKKAKSLKRNQNYHGGTVDFLVLKAVTMISSELSTFREDGLEKTPGKDKLKLYATPYTFHELAGLLNTAKEFKKAEFPKSQLYQIRTLLERGKNTAILNYRYFRGRLSLVESQELLKEHFEDAWCKAKTNNGNLAPWMSMLNNSAEDSNKTTYETIWRELVDIYPFIEKEEQALQKESDRSISSEV